MKKRLIGATVITVLVALFVSNFISVWMMRKNELASTYEELRAILILLDAQSAVTDAEALAEQFMLATPENRLTIISPDGTVLCDTNIDPSDLGDHADRPEIIQAIATGWGESTRYSESLQTNMLYVAKEFEDGLIGRASMPLTSILTLLWEGIGGFVIASIIALILALFLARRTATMALTPLNMVGQSLQGVVDGTHTPHVNPQTTYEEVRPIIRYIDKLMERLGGYIDSIRTERDKVNLILDCMDEGLILLSDNGKILAANRAARGLFGVPLREENSELLISRSLRLRESIDTALLHRTPQVVDVDALTNDERCLRLFISPVSERQYEGVTVAVSILVSDITALKKAEGIRAEFTANVSHELKTPLTSIKGFTDMLSSGMVSNEEDQRRFLTMMGVEVDRLIDLINDILKLSELESVAIEQQEACCDVLEIAQAVTDLLTASAQQGEITLTLSGQSATTAIPATRLKELLINLIGNGIKYNEPGGTVHTEISTTDTMAIITVSDTGIGIPEEAKIRVFERFYRVDKGRSRQSGGTGLGLAIVKHMVQLYNGTLTLESKLGEGSTFTVALPLIPYP